MDDDRMIAALRRFEDGTPGERPLPVAARTRIEARIERAFDDARSAPDIGEITELETGAHDRAPRSRSIAGMVAAAAAAVVLVAAFVALRPAEPDVPADRPIDPVPAALLEPGARWALATELDPDVDGVSASVTIVVDGDLPSPNADGRVVGARARISTADVPPLQYLGSVRFVVDSSGAVRVPLVLLDPARPWVDCDATVDLTAEGVVTCGADTVGHTSTQTRTDTVDTPIGRLDATGTSVDWSLDGSADRHRTTIWSAPGIGPVRIDIERIDDNDDDVGAIRTYRLTELDRPTTDPTGE